MPRRVKVEGDLFHGRVPEGAVYVGRAAPGLPASPWANLYPVKDHGRGESVAHFFAWLTHDPNRVAAVRRDLAGKDLACWCPLDVICHADVLLKIANGRSV